MSRRAIDPDEQAAAATTTTNLIEEFLAKTSSLRNSKEEKERQNEVISYAGGLTETAAGGDSYAVVAHLDDEGESTSSDNHVRNTDSGFSTICDYGSDVNCTPKRSCFIDASTLYDENEFDSLPSTTATGAESFRASISSNNSSTSSSSQPRSDSRQENEKRQGYLVFKNSIHQYSGHPISTSSNSNSKEAEDFEIVDFPEENGTPQNSLAYIPTAAHDDDRGRVEDPAPILTAAELYSSRAAMTKRQKHDESAPIVSGGASLTDFKPSMTESPAVRRRTEMCPIVSGGFCDTDLPVETKEPKKRSSSVTSASWVVDVSSLRGSSHTTEAKNDFSSLKYTRETSSPKPSLSFYVNLEPEKKETKELRDYETPKSLQLTKSTGFFIDLSGDKEVPKEKKKITAPEPVVIAKKQEETDTKNIFSMFIDFGENKKPRTGTPRLSNSSFKSLDGSFRGATAQNKDNKEVTEQKPAVIKASEQEETKIPETPSPDKQSLTSESFTSNTNSHDGGVNGGKKQQDAKINETFDKSSLGSLTDGILSKDLSPISSTETDDATFQRDSDGSFVPQKKSESKESIIRSQESDMQIAMDSIQARIEIQKQALLDTPTSDGGTFVKLSDMDKQPKSLTGLEDVQKPRGKGMSASAGMTGIKKHNWLGDLGTQNGDLGKQTNLSPSEGNVNSIPLASSVENSKSLSRLFPHLSDVFSKSLPNDSEFTSYRNSNYLSDIAQSDISNTTTSSVTSGLDSPDESSISCRQPRRLGEDLLKMFLQEIATDITVEVGSKKMRAHKCILRSRCQYFAAILAGNWVANAGNVISLSGYSYAAVHFALCHIYSGASYPPEGISLMELASLSDLLGLEGLKEVTTYALKINYCHNFHKPCSGCIEGVMQVFPVTLNHGLDDLYRKCLKWSCKYWGKIWTTRSFALLPTDVIYRCRQSILSHMSSESVLNSIIDCEQMLSVLELSRWAVLVENVVREILESAHMYIADHFANLLASDSFLSLGHGKSWAITNLEDLLLRTASTLTPDQACKSYPRAVRLNTLLTVPNSLSFDNSKKSKDHSDDDDSLTWNEDFVRLVSAILTAVEQCLIRQCSRAMKCSSFQRMDPNLKSKIQKLACITDVIEEKKLTSMRNKLNSNYQIASYQSRDSGLNQIRMAIQAHNNKSNRAPAPVPLQPSVSTATANKPNVPKMGMGSKTHRFVDETRFGSLPTAMTKQIPRAENVERLKVAQNGGNSTGSSRKSSNFSVLSEAKNSSSSGVSSSLPKSRLADVKPRYLEPKKLHVAEITRGVGNKSNASSRTASPTVVRKNKMADSKASQDSNISLDSLTSPMRKKSSIISSKHTSKESLTAFYQANGMKGPQKENVDKNGKASSVRSARSRIGSGSSTQSHSSSLAPANRTVRNLKSKSTDTSPGNAPKSFFTQRSRNILMKREQKFGSSVPVPVPVQLPTSARERNKLRSQLGVSNVPLPVTAKTTTSKAMANPLRKSASATSAASNKSTTAKIDVTKAKNEKNKKKSPVQATIVYERVEELSGSTTSRLERSSTFCKESSDITDLVTIE
ncbi:uncharacterized protein LOC134829410 [Culicoides brevitarsis]|uniref:uncharacterized protein LOC134829410 n=1 Tax=Culicoides brevitarsis TaxID=469753 RepID=UPI00307C2F6B